MDLNWGQTNWNKLFQRVGIPSSVYFALLRIRDELKTDQIIIEEFWDPNAYLSGWSLNEVRLMENTDEEGLLYVSIVANGPNWDVNVWSDSARSALVAKGTTTGALPETITLAEQNNSGMTGAVTVAAGVAADSDIWLRPKVGLLKQADDMLIDDTLDSYLKADMMSALMDVLGYIGSAISRVESFTTIYLMPYVAGKIDAQGTATTVPDETDDGYGAISFENTGILADLVDAMNDETVPAAQTIDTAGFIMTGTYAVADVDNTGAGSLLMSAPFQYAKNGGMITFECIDETIGSEAFSAVLRTAEGDAVTPRHNLTVKKSWLSTDFGVKVAMLYRTIVDSGLENDHFDTWAFNGETSENTNDGNLYCVYTSGTKLLEVFKDAGRAAADLVCSGTWDGVDGSTVTLAQQNLSGLTGSCKVHKIAAVDPATTNTLAVNLQVFKEGDKFYLALAPWVSSDFLNFFGWQYKTELPFSAAGKIHAGYANRGYSGLRTE